MKLTLASLAMSALVACTASTSPPPTYATSTTPPPPPAYSEPTPAPMPAPIFDSTGWTLLGSQTVEGRRDRDVFPVGKQEGRFDKLTVVVQESDVDVASMLVTFGNGTTFEPPLKHSFREGQRSRAIDLPGNDRFIQSIELRYGNTPGGGKARIEIWAKDSRH